MRCLRPVEALPEDPDAVWKDELCAVLAGSIRERLPGHLLDVEVIKGMLLGRLAGELLDVELGEGLLRHAEVMSLYERTTNYVFGALPVFGDAIDEATAEGRRRRRIVNAAIHAAVETQQDLELLMTTGDPTAPVERRTTQIVKRNRQRRRWVRASVVIIAIIGPTIWWLTPLPWNTIAVIGVVAVIAFAVGVYGYDRHDHG
jgi:hypothetical protein